MCKAEQPHRWQATVGNRSHGRGCPHESGKAACPCNDLAHNHPKVAEEWDWEANGEDTGDCDSKQQYQSGLEVCPLWAQLDRSYQQEDTRDWMPPVWA